MASNSGARPHNIRADDYPDRGKDCLLFYCPEAEPLARDIAQASARVELGEVQWNRFEDGFPNLFVKNALTIRNRHVGFLASFHSTEAIFEQISLIYALPRLFVSSFTLVLPFFPTGTHERVRKQSFPNDVTVDGQRSNPKEKWQRHSPSPESYPISLSREEVQQVSSRTTSMPFKSGCMSTRDGWYERCVDSGTVLFWRRSIAPFRKWHSFAPECPGRAAGC